MGLRPKFLFLLLVIYLLEDGRLIVAFFLHFPALGLGGSATWAGLWWAGGPAR